MTYDELQVIYGDDLHIIETDLSEINGLKGLYIDGCVAIEKRLTLKEKACVLAEEIGHHITTAGNILDQSNTNNRKQERKARSVGYNIKIGLKGIMKSYEAGCRNLYEVAEYLDVTESFLQEAICYYKEKYGTCTKLDNYIIYFEPTIAIIKII